MKFSIAFAITILQVMPQNDGAALLFSTSGQPSTFTHEGPEVSQKSRIMSDSQGFHFESSSNYHILLLEDEWVDYTQAVDDWLDSPGGD